MDLMAVPFEGITESINAYQTFLVTIPLRRVNSLIYNS